MKLKLFRDKAVRAQSGRAKSAAVTPAPRHVPAEPPPPVWSLLLPPGFSANQRR